MLTIAIPTYNYNAFPLVERVHFLCSKATISFEILCYDDGSTQPETIEANQKINSLPYSKYIFGNQNKGASFARNWLLSNANYSNILLLDADMMPEQEDFIQKYLPFLNSEYELVYGGLYYKNLTDSSKMLRYIYGKKREELTVKQREKKHYKITMFNNTLFHKYLFKKIQFDETILNCGYEDFLFMIIAEKLKINVIHIDNAIAHFNEETSKIYVSKTEKSLVSLLNLYNENKIFSKDSSLLKANELLKKLKLTNLYVFFYTSFKPIFYKNLTSKKPNLFIFDLYKLGYFIQLTKKI